MKWLAEGARGLSPAYFALVMATGIVSIASDRARLRAIAAVLLWLNAGQYLLLWILTAWRLLRYRRALLDDLRLLTPTIVEMNSLRTADTGPA
jgi:tellurite resistance protein TehA-like permease